MIYRIVTNLNNKDVVLLKNKIDKSSIDEYNEFPYSNKATNDTNVIKIAIFIDNIDSIDKKFSKIIKFINVNLDQKLKSLIKMHFINVKICHVLTFLHQLQQSMKDLFMDAQN